MFEDFTESQAAEAFARLFEVEPKREEICKRRRCSRADAAVITDKEPGPHASRAINLSEGFLRQAGKWAAKGWLYDPGRRRFVPHAAGVDPEPESAFFLHRPLPWRADGPERDESGLPPARPLGLHILHPDTQRQPASMRLLERHLARRFVGARARSVHVVRASAADTESQRKVTVRQVARTRTVPERDEFEAAEAGADDGPAPAAHGPAVAGARADEPTVSERMCGAPLGRGVNEAIRDAIAAGADLIVVECGDPFSLRVAGSVEVDDIVPVYPVVLDTGAIVLTPAQAEQLNGVDPGADTPADVVNSLLTRAGSTIGAVLVPPGVQAPAPPRHADTGWHAHGLSSVRDGLESDGRVTRLRACTGRHAARVGHGWLSQDTHAGLLAALRAAKPTCVLELGSWYGKSTRAIRREAPGATILAVDWYKNNARLDWPMKKLGPGDKLFLNHPRFEAFAANMLACEAQVARGAVAAGRAGAGSASSAATAAADAAAASGAEDAADDEAASGTEAAPDGPAAALGVGATYLVQADAHEAVEMLRALVAATPAVDTPQVVFVDCEKKTAKLRSLLAGITAAFPQAIIVGDDLVYGSVQAVVDALPAGRCIPLSEAYVLAPEGWPAARRAGLKALMADAREELRPSAEQDASAAFVAHSQLTQLFEWHAPPAVLHAPLPFSMGGTLLHDLCRRRDAKALRAVWPRFVEAAESWRAPLANSAQLTPWDYLAHFLQFFT